MMATNNQENIFYKADHTIVVSDIHLTTAEPLNPKKPLWKKYKRKEFFIDDAFAVFIEKIKAQTGNTPIELVLAGDILDFDGVTQLPETYRFKVSWLEKKRGLNSEERKSRFKMKLIIESHLVFFKTLSKFIKEGNRLVFIIGNHDLELHWDSVKKQFLQALELTEEEQSRVRFNNWFYLSNQDTLIEHGNQHDSHSNCQNPINPKIKGVLKERIRLPFGCLANRYMMNGMGFFNPHSDRTYIMSTKQYLIFFFRNVVRQDPLLMWNWFWGAAITLIVTLTEGFMPDVKDPLAVEDQVEEIARNSNATPKMVRALKEVHAPPSFMDPIGVARELWIDRSILFLIAISVAFQIFSFLNLVWQVSLWWFIGISLLFMPFFIFYFRSFKSKVIVDVKYYERAVKYGSRITGTKRVIFGHTHEFVHANFDGIEYLNSGTWSPAFDDMECTKPSCPKSFVWIKPTKDGPRTANVFEWKNHDIVLLC